MNLDRNLQEKLTRLFQVAKNFPPGAILDVDLAHDPGCPAIRSGRISDCSCQPEFRFREREKEAIGKYQNKRKK